MKKSLSTITLCFSISLGTLFCIKPIISPIKVSATEKNETSNQAIFEPINENFSRAVFKSNELPSEYSKYLKNFPKESTFYIYKAFESRTIENKWKPMEFELKGELLYGIKDTLFYQMKNLDKYPEVDFYYNPLGEKKQSNEWFNFYNDYRLGVKTILSKDEDLDLYFVRSNKGIYDRNHREFISKPLTYTDVNVSMSVIRRGFLEDPWEMQNNYFISLRNDNMAKDINNNPLNIGIEDYGDYIEITVLDDLIAGTWLVRKNGVSKADYNDFRRRFKTSLYSISENNKDIKYFPLTKELYWNKLLEENEIKSNDEALNSSNTLNKKLSNGGEETRQHFIDFQNALLNEKNYALYLNSGGFPGGTQGLYSYQYDKKDGMYAFRNNSKSLLKAQKDGVYYDAEISDGVYKLNKIEGTFEDYIKRISKINLDSKVWELFEKTKDIKGADSLVAGALSYEQLINLFPGEVPEYWFDFEKEKDSFSHYKVSLTLEDNNEYTLTITGYQKVKTGMSNSIYIRNIGNTDINYLIEEFNIEIEEP